MELHIGLDNFGLVKLDKCLLINKYVEIKKIPVKKDVPKATSTTSDKNKKSEANKTEENKVNGNEETSETVTEDAKKNGGMEDVTNLQQKDNDMTDAPKEENKEDKKEETKTEEYPTPVQEYEEVKKNKKREIECLISFKEQEGRYPTKEQMTKMKELEQYMSEKDRLAHENKD